MRASLPSMERIRAAHERAVDEIAALMHERFCGCAAREPDGDSHPWCDSVYPATAERVVLHYQQTMGSERGSKSAD